MYLGLDVVSRLRAGQLTSNSSHYLKPPNVFTSDRNPHFNNQILKMLSTLIRIRPATQTGLKSSRIAFFHAKAPQGRRLEVERKFLVTPASLGVLRSVEQKSIFKKHENLGFKTTHDVYYDRDGLLFAKGIYIRKRNSLWEAKIRTGGDFLNSAFLEVDGSDTVRDAVKKYLNIPLNDLSIEEVLSPCADFVTDRESWMLDGKFQVDVDTTDFEHMVGEVELTSYLKYGDGHHGVDHKLEEDMRANMDMEIKNFMDLYPQAFPSGRPLGKLSVYFQLNQKV